MNTFKQEQQGTSYSSTEDLPGKSKRNSNGLWQEKHFLAWNPQKKKQKAFFWQRNAFWQGIQRGA
jgi:hypothetical protein